MRKCTTKDITEFVGWSGCLECVEEVLAPTGKKVTVVTVKWDDGCGQSETSMYRWDAAHGGFIFCGDRPPLEDVYIEDISGLIKWEAKSAYH